MKTSCAFKPMSSLLHCLPAAELRGELLIGQRKEVCFGGGGASLWPFVSICSMTFALWSLLFPAHPHPVHIHHTSGLLWQHSPLTFLRHLHLLLIKWTGSDPPSRGTDREKDGVAMISSRRKYILLNGKLSRWTCCVCWLWQLLSQTLQDCHYCNNTLLRICAYDTVICAQMTAIALICSNPHSTNHCD